MKFLIVLAAAVALVSAEVSQVYVRTDEYQAPIIRSDYEISPQGSYAYAYETGNGIAVQAEGIVKNPETDQATLDVKGSVRFTAPDGTPIEWTYEADQDGYRPVGSHIPTIPPAILRSLEFIASQPRQVEYVKKTV